MILVLCVSIIFPIGFTLINSNHCENWTIYLSLSFILFLDNNLDVQWSNNFPNFLNVNNPNYWWIYTLLFTLVWDDNLDDRCSNNFPFVLLIATQITLEDDVYLIFFTLVWDNLMDVLCFNNFPNFSIKATKITMEVEIFTLYFTLV